MAELNQKDLILLCFFIISTYILLSKLLWSSSLEITYITANETITKTIPSIFTYSDGIILAFAGIVFGITIFQIYLDSKAEESEIQNKGQWRKTLNRLKGKEKQVYGILMEHDGFLFQKELRDELSLPKSTLTILLDRMEAKALIKRERRGIGNVVVLK